MQVTKLEGRDGGDVVSAVVCVVVKHLERSVEAEMALP